MKKIFFIILLMLTFYSINAKPHRYVARCEKSNRGFFGYDVVKQTEAFWIGNDHYFDLKCFDPGWSGCRLQSIKVQPIPDDPYSIIIEKYNSLIFEYLNKCLEVEENSYSNGVFSGTYTTKVSVPELVAKNAFIIFETKWQKGESENINQTIEFYVTEIPY